MRAHAAVFMCVLRVYARTGILESRTEKVGGRKMGASAISDSDAVKKLGCPLYLDNWRANHILSNSRGEMVRWLINDGIHQHR